MQDYNYIYAGCLELTLEISCCKFPANETALLTHWRRNRDALVLLAVQAHIGVCVISVAARFSVCHQILLTAVCLAELMMHAEQLQLVYKVT